MEEIPNEISGENEPANENQDTFNETSVEEMNNLSVVSKDVIKVISFDDENLDISMKEKLLFDEVRRIFEIVDNVFRVLLPFIFFIYIIVLMSNEK